MGGWEEPGTPPQIVCTHVRNSARTACRAPQAVVVRYGQVFAVCLVRVAPHGLAKSQRVSLARASKGGRITAGLTPGCAPTCLSMKAFSSAPSGVWKLSASRPTSPAKTFVLASMKVQLMPRPAAAVLAKDENPIVSR